MNTFVLAIGWTVIAIGVAVVLLTLIAIVQEVLGRRIWERAQLIHELYVVVWWMERVKATGWTIPTKRRVDRLLHQIKKES